MWTCFSPNSINRFLVSFQQHHPIREQTQSFDHHSTLNNSSREESRLCLSKFKHVPPFSDKLDKNTENGFNRSDQFRAKPETFKKEPEPIPNEDTQHELSNKEKILVCPTCVNLDGNRIPPVLSRVENPTCQTLKTEERLLYHEPTPKPKPTKCTQINSKLSCPGDGSGLNFNSVLISSSLLNPHMEHNHNNDIHKPTPDEPDPADPIKVLLPNLTTVSVVSPPLLQLTSDIIKGYIYQTLDFISSLKPFKKILC